MFVLFFMYYLRSAPCMGLRVSLVLLLFRLGLLLAVCYLCVCPVLNSCLQVISKCVVQVTVEFSIKIV